MAMTRKTTQERIVLSLKLRESLRHYLEMDTWTPVMGAMLLSGIRPEVGCVELPTHGGDTCVGLDGSIIRECVSTPFFEARKIMDAWHERCEDDENFPDKVSPTAFIDWCVEDQVQERLAVLSPCFWIDVFKDLAGYAPRSELIDFDVAAYVSKTAAPLQTILDRLDELSRVASYKEKEEQAYTFASSSAAGRHEPEKTIRAYVTTEQLAAALHVEPESIHKARSKNGHYCGVHPIKLPNRRLAWPPDAVEQITKGG
jgi:hypothetical protein